MHSYTIHAPAKINLFLEILGDRPDGFHELVMVLQSIALGDEITVRANGTDDIRLSCGDSPLANDATNLAHRAAQLMINNFPQAHDNYGGVDITLTKHIPMAAGLAGGSADAAAVLVGLDLLWNLGLTRPELEQLAAQLGSDIPFCIGGGTAIATGRGEILDPLPDGDCFWVVLAKHRSLEVSTPWAYQTYRQQFGKNYLNDDQSQRARRKTIHAGPLLQGIHHRNPGQIASHIHNDLEKVVLPAHQPVAQLRQALQSAGGLGTMMSGSGPSVFTLCQDQQEAERVLAIAKEKLNDPDVDFWLTHTIGHGIQIMNN
ncbi:4-(cytidine 5'-diphospho)-2-C-methyl-D-erythritol kinase [Synechocystis sp. CACIAM 05]|uniref:4-(cytidine 5'-diphospho)-2-C-methyl-D-erythritol kinase n=1 Tax=Synechocystis sp. CACIAM 05 TaxID=1933929 RepID=UPI00138E5CEC|nr:4-(cytidine 5'-diphospho)-2-C-methyl-D-erythritol kinase [Synechocystis sp. CACIAM 05]QHU98786.1 4-(cytidine 5'-diphospho)-2-C-methyl-D-erythritol kinase [Synechocystis sp. CACIAM 05]